MKISINSAVIVCFLTAFFLNAQAAEESQKMIFLKTIKALQSVNQLSGKSCIGEWPDCLAVITPRDFTRPETASILKQRKARLKKDFALQGLEFGAPIMIRIIKHPHDLGKSLAGQGTLMQLSRNMTEGELELWVRSNGGRYILFKTYPICALVGIPGPKRNDKDNHSPEGFYSLKVLNPNSNYHFSFDVGYPNAFDVASRKNGSEGAGNLIMVHGDCVTAGCFAMTDPQIEEIYAVVDEAMNQNEMSDGSAYAVPIQIFPFPMGRANLDKLDPRELSNLSAYLDKDASENFDVKQFWENLKEGYDQFELDKAPSEIAVQKRNGKVVYQFQTPKVVPVKRKCP